MRNTAESAITSCGIGQSGSLSLRERAGVRGVAGLATQEMTVARTMGLAVTLTPALSRRERETERLASSRFMMDST
jgi:hypothetical protein